MSEVENAAVEGEETPVAEEVVEAAAPRRGRPPKVQDTSATDPEPIGKPYKLAKGAIVTGCDGVRVKWEDMANYTVNLDDEAADRLREAGVILV